MNIIGWIRVGDRATCGSEVIEGLTTCTGYGIPYSFQGAHIACGNNCIIAEGYARSTLPNGRNRVLHGMQTSGGCLLHSTLNDIDGVSNVSEEAIARHPKQDHGGKRAGESCSVPPASSSETVAMEEAANIAVATSSGICLDCLLKAAAAGSATVVRN